MIIETGTSHPGEIWIIFEEPDFRLKDGKGRDIWFECKERIKEAFPYPTGRWNGEIKAWIITDTEENRELMQGIKEEFFGNAKQESLF